MSTFWDTSRSRHVVSTPEEVVRQSLLEWLWSQKRVPRHLTETEFALSKIQPGQKGRVDVIVHGFREGKSVQYPWLLAECKRPGEGDWRSLEIQMNRYLRVLHPEYLMLALGTEYRFFKLETGENGKSHFLEVQDIPGYPMELSK